ncbi:hypothetical protein TSOC_004059, partial [Tetrabaena socialis]
MALPGELRDAAMRLPAAAARLVGVPGSGLPLEAEEAEQIADLLVTLGGAFMDDNPDDGATVDALLANDRLRLAMLHLTAFAARVSQQSIPAFHEVAVGALAGSGSLLNVKVNSAWRGRVMLDFAHKLLRMHTLQCCSLAFAEAVEAMTAGAGQMAAGGGDGGDAEAAAAAAAGPPDGGGEAGPAAAAVVITAGATAAQGGGGAEAVPGPSAAAAAGVEAPQDQRLLAHSSLLSKLLSVLLGLTIKHAARTVLTTRQLQQFEEQQRLYAHELSTALRDSRVLEHGARLALHAQLAKPAGGIEADRHTYQLTYVIHLVEHLKDDSTAAPALCEVLSGPCVRHLVLSLGLAALCMADGGPSHGLPPELLLRLPIFGGGDRDLRGMHGRQRLSVKVLLGMVRLLQRSTAASATPPLDWRSVVGLLRRIGAFVLASAGAWADEAAVAEAGPQPPPLQLVLDADDIMVVAVSLLERFWLLILDDKAAAACARAALIEVEAACWRLAVDVATRCVRWAQPRDVLRLVVVLRPKWRPLPANGALPAVAPPAVEAALAGGLLPLWERLLRHAGRDPLSKEATLLMGMLLDCSSPETVWSLLAYCEPRQGAALVATWGKLLRTLAVPQLLSSMGGGCAAANERRSTLACHPAISAVRLLGAAAERLPAVGRRDPAAPEATAPQLLLAGMISCAVCEWLPPLARLVREGLPALQRAQLTGQADQRSKDSILSCASAVLPWLPMLARRSSPGLAAAGAAGTSAAAPNAGAPAEAGWRQLLLQEVGAVELLGAACHFTAWSRHVSTSAQAADLQDVLPALVNSCCCVAAACPGERGGRGSSGRGGGGGPSRGAAIIPPGWSPQLLQMLVAQLQPRQGDGTETLAAAASALARQAGQWAAGGGENGGELAHGVLCPQPEVEAGSRALASSPAEARALLRTCANPACDNLAGDSEAGLPLRACGRCGGAWYCRKECLAAHWRSGHREACLGQGPAAAGAQFKEQQRLYARELAAALRDSRVLEHGARLALHAQLAEPAGGMSGGEAHRLHGYSTVLLTYVVDLFEHLKDDGTAAPALCEVLSGPCVRHLALSLGLVALCAADGGPSHGLPPELLLRLPIIGRASGDLRGMHGRQQLSAEVLLGMLGVLQHSTAASDTPPLGWRSVVGLLRRIGAFVLASAGAWADEAAVAEAGPQPPPLQLVLDAGDVMAVAVSLLERFWQLINGVLPAVAPRAGAAALAGGLLALWERLLRYAGRDPLSKEASLLASMLPDCSISETLWSLLADCEPRQGAALVATWGKLLRTLAVPQVLSSMGGGCGAADTRRTYLACTLATCAAMVLDEALKRLTVAGWHDAAAAGPSPPQRQRQRQLAGVISCVVCEWLPPLARLAREGLPALQRAQLTGQADLQGQASILACACYVPPWLPVLARRSSPGFGTTAAAGASAAAPNAGAPAEAGWRQLLLQEVGAVVLLGGVCHFTAWSRHVSTSALTANLQVALPTLLYSCCCVAAACPGEVRQAVLAAAAEAAASTRGGRAGVSGAGGGRQRGGRGSSGRGGGGGPSRGAATIPPGWSPQLLEVLVAQVQPRQGNGPEAPAAATSALARQAELWAAGGGEDGGELARAVGGGGLKAVAAARALASSPAGARALLRTCANPACDNLAGDSEAGLPLRACGRCGGAWYCRQECLAAHWRSGHREAPALDAAAAAQPLRSRRRHDLPASLCARICATTSTYVLRQEGSWQSEKKSSASAVAAASADPGSK